MTVDTEGTDLAWPEPSEPLHQPRRGLVAAIEVLAAAGLVWLAVVLWGAGITAVAPVEGHPQWDYLHYSGEWIGLSVLSATVAALLVIDALRNAALARKG